MPVQMQNKVLLENTTMSAARSAAVEFRPYGIDDIGVVVVKVFQTGASAPTRPTSDSFVELQGSIDSTTWAVLARLNMSSAATSLDFYSPESSAFASGSGSYMSSIAVVQLMPYLRVNYPTLANASINVVIAEG